MAERYDVAIIGAGVVGCAIFRQFTLAGLSCLLLERGVDILSGASKGNSGILHTGFDAPPGSLEHACIRRGYAEYLNIREKLNLPLLPTEAMVIAWTREQQDKLPGILDKAHKNGVLDVRLIGKDEIYEKEPALGDGARQGVLIPGESIIDPWSAPLAYTSQAVANGGQVVFQAEVRSGRLENNIWHLETGAGNFEADTVLNCAGNFGDQVESINRPSPFQMIPRKGQYLVYDKPAADLFRAVILPVPTQRTKGVVVCRTIFGNVLVGPTAEDQEDRELAETVRETLLELKQKGEAILPGLTGLHLNAAYAALRPATQFDEYQIESQPQRRWITVAGIRSTGLSASLGIAAFVLDLYEKDFGPVRPLADPIWTPVPNLAEHRSRPYQEPEAGEMVCFCELVTAKEIEAAFKTPLPPGDAGGLKRRTRCTMGRCQGYYCGHRVDSLTADKLEQPPPFEDIR